MIDGRFAPHARWLLGRLGVRVVATDVVPSAPGRLVVANHIGFIDILALAAWRPLAFVAKREVAEWPVIGAFARAQGTLFIDRTPTRALRATIDQITAMLGDGRDVLVFPEATTSDGSGVLPFRPACFEAARRAGAPVDCVELDYRWADGRPARHAAAWVGDEWLVSGVLRRAAGAPLVACIRSLGVLDASAPVDRKALARLAQARIAAQRLSPHARVAGVVERGRAAQDVGARRASAKQNFLPIDSSDFEIAL